MAGNATRFVRKVFVASEYFKGKIELDAYQVSDLPSAEKYEGTLVTCLNGNAGSKCLAFADSGIWKVIGILGAEVSTS